ncbi:MAG TPA: antitoxin family protein [Planctomycetaceae bacterium]|nr:antitoxin family protein [Planctomycetaceae bacterium]
MKLALDAIYENGAFRPIGHEPLNLADGQRVRVTVEEAAEPEPLRLAARVYEGLAEAEIDEIERIALNRREFFRSRSAD